MCIHRRTHHAGLPEEVEEVSLDRWWGCCPSPSWASRHYDWDYDFFDGHFLVHTGSELLFDSGGTIFSCDCHSVVHTRGFYFRLCGDFDHFGFFQV